MKKLIAIAVLLATAGIGYFVWQSPERNPAAPVYRTMTVERGKLVSTVNASGSLNPVQTILVGSQISGNILSIGADYNARVKAGQVIARIDPAKIEARRDQALADLAVSQAALATKQANLARVKADIAGAEAQVNVLAAQVAEARSALDDRTRDHKRKQALSSRKVISDAAVETAQANLDQSRSRLTAAKSRLVAQRSTLAAQKSALAIARSEIKTAEAQIENRKAALKSVDVDLGYTYIRSPVDGVVIDRNVDVGQTVAASLQAPVLFTIAQSLDNMQVEVNVDEADIGRVRPDMTAAFTVDAFPNRKFAAKVEQIRLQPTTQQNVVTYTVVLNVENRERLLLPGMTANVEIVTQERNDVLKVSNAALRFKPPAAARNAQDSTGGGNAAGERARRTIAFLSEQLSLTPDQRQQLIGFFTDARDEIVALRAGGAAGADFRDAVAKIRKQIGQSIPTILTGAQLEKYREIVARRNANPVRRAQVWIVGDDKSLTPATVWIGASDGNFTEVVRGDLEEGQKAATGVEKTRDRKTGGLFGLRF